jgi:flagellar basal-body rod modification protein FlgD
MSLDISSYLANQTPSGLDSTGGSATDKTLTSGTKNLASSYTTFLTLLTAQLKNQDPTSPMDTNNFTQQLTQMTGVQQQLLSNQLLQQLVAQKDGYSAVGLIGKTAMAKGGDVAMTDGKADWAYELASAATTATINIADASGKVVWSGTAPDLGAGRHDFAWDGKDNTGHALPDGTYTMSVSATGADGKSITTTPYITGVVSSIENAADGTLVHIGAAKVPLSAIIQVGS